MREVERRAEEAYRKTFGREPEVVASAPGRINLIGEHTDYNGGFVLPCAVDRRVAVAAGEGGGRLYSDDFDDIRPLQREEKFSWAYYPRGVAWSLEQSGNRPGTFRAAFAGDVPRGSGLSSSAAIEAATALALDRLFGFELPRRDLALICQRAENEYIGVQTGIMDQYASLLCEAGAALLIDCRTLEARSVPLDLERADLALVVCDTRVERGLAGTGYNERRKSCEDAARTLGIKELRDAAEADLKRLSGEELKRARHVVTENRRVMEAVEALRAEDYGSFGRLMYASHASLCDDYEVSTPELDTFVECAKEEGALGARLTGAGFGGCAIALIPAGGSESLCKNCRRRFAEEGFKEPAFYSFLPASGAEVVR